MPETIDKAVWLEDLERAHDVVELLERTYPGDEWTGGLVFQDLQGGFVLAVCFNAEQYPGECMRFEALFPPRDLRSFSLKELCAPSNRYRLWLGDGLAAALRHLKLLPT